MKFVEIKESDYAAFVRDQPQPNFWQSVDMMHLREMRGWSIAYVGVHHQDRLIAVAALSLRKVARCFSIAQAVRGFYIDYHNRELMTFFHKELIRYLRKQGCIVLRTDPYVCYKQRDIDGKLVKDGFDNTDVVELLKCLHYRHHGFLTGTDNEREPNWMFVLDLDGKEEAQLLKAFATHTRRAINKTIKIGIRVRSIKEDEMPKFKAIMDHTARRRGFEDHDSVYYHQLFQTFGKSGHLDIVLAELDLDDYRERLFVQQKALKEELKTIEGHLKQIPESKKLDKKRNILLDDLKINDKNLDEVKMLYEHAENGILTLAGATFIHVGKEMVYLYGGAYQEYMHLRASYAVQWHMIRYALSLGLTRYNFYGISGHFEKGDEGYGVYDFKRGFTGHVEQLIGDFEYPIRPLVYALYQYLYKLKQKIK